MIDFTPDVLALPQQPGGDFQEEVMRAPARCYFARL
jgi:hypothetical protein